MIAWRRSLAQLDYDADIAFFGDSITAGGNWQEWFPEYAVINLGVPGNALEDMDERIEIGFSLFIEIIQLITSRGCFDFDDVLLNGLGTVIGFGIFQAAKRLFTKNELNAASN